MLKLKAVLVDNHSNLDKLRQVSRAKKHRLRELKEKMMDVTRDGAGNGAAGRRKGGAVLTKEPRVLVLTAKLSKFKVRMEAMLAERLSMECMRERLESEWIIAVARLRDKRAILVHHEQQDEALTKDYLNQCRREHCKALDDLTTARALMQDDGKQRQLALIDLRSQVSSELSAIRMEGELEQKRQLIVKESDGDMDEEAEKRLKKRVVVTHIRGLKVGKQTNLSWEQRLDIVVKLEKIKEATGGLLAGDADELDSEMLSSRLIGRYDELKAAGEELRVQQAQNTAKLRDLQGRVENAMGAKACVSEFGLLPDVVTTRVIGFDARKRKAQDSLRLSLRMFETQNKLISAIRYMVQTAMTALKIYGANSLTVSSMTKQDNRLEHWLVQIGDHLEAMLDGLPNGGQMDLGGNNGSLDLAVMTAMRTGSQFAPVRALPVQPAAGTGWRVLQGGVCRTARQRCTQRSTTTGKRAVLCKHITYRDCMTDLNGNWPRYKALISRRWI